MRLLTTLLISSIVCVIIVTSWFALTGTTISFTKSPIETAAERGAVNDASTPSVTTSVETAQVASLIQHPKKDLEHLAHDDTSTIVLNESGVNQRDSESATPIRSPIDPLITSAHGAKSPIIETAVGTSVNNIAANDGVSTIKPRIYLNEQEKINDPVSNASKATASKFRAIAAAPGSLTTVNGPTLILSQGTASIYTSICPSTDEGAQSLTSALNSLDPNVTRAFIYDHNTSAYVEMPLQGNRVGLTKNSGLVIATRVPLTYSLDGTPTDLSTTLSIPSNGWTFIGIPLLRDGQGLIKNSVDWNDTNYLTVTLEDGNYTTLSGDSLISAMGTVNSADINTARPWFWNGAAYIQVDTLEVGKAYWFKNNDTTNGITITINDPNAGDARSNPVSASRAATTTATYRDQGQPPALPSSPSAESSSGSSCGAGAGIASFLMVFLFMSLRLRSTKP
jgi:hypothetical protein